MKKQTTRMRLLEKGAEIIHSSGYHHTGIQEILKAAQVPKGSFYFYFKSKEDFCLALIDYYSKDVDRQVDAYLKEGQTPPLQRLRQFFAHYRRHYKTRGFAKGSALGNLASEMSAVSDTIREKLCEALDRIEAALAACLAEASRKGDLPAHIDPQETAAFLYNSWEGTLLRMKTTRSVTPLRHFEKTVFSLLVHAPDPAAEDEHQSVTI